MAAQNASTPAAETKLVHPLGAQPTFANDNKGAAAAPAVQVASPAATPEDTKAQSSSHASFAANAAKTDAPASSDMKGTPPPNQQLQHRKQHRGLLRPSSHSL